MKTKAISDLGLVAGLMSKGYQPLERIKEGRRVDFIFETDEILEGLCDDFYNNRMDVDANTFAQQLKSLKKVLYLMEREGQ